MSLLKSKVKIGTVQEIGNHLDDIKEDCEKDTLRAEGYELALKDLEKGLTSIFEAVDIDRDEGVFDEHGNALELAGLVKKGLTRVAGAIDNLRIRNEKAKLIRDGKVKGLEAGIKQAKKIYDAEVRKVEAIEEGLRDGTIAVEGEGVLRQSAVQGRASGVHPGNPLADLKDREVDEASGNGQSGPVVAAKPAKPRKKATVRKKRRTKKKSPSKEADAANA